VDKIIVPLAEIKTAGVIIAVKTVSDAESASMTELEFSDLMRREQTKAVQTGCRACDMLPG